MNQVKIITAFLLRNCLKISLLAIPFFTLLLIISNKAKAQPYLDIINLKYSFSPDAEIFNQKKNANKLLFFGAGTNIPIQFKNKKDALIFSPFFEKWTSHVSNNNRRDFYSVGLPVTLSKSLPGNRWNILATGIIRMNDSSLRKNGFLQVGGAMIASYKRSEKLTWKLGVYINNECFGVFIMPLAGIMWNINQKNILFGVLPGNLTFEHKINQSFYYGANFRAITNSYGKALGYWRIDENQLGIYLDTYFTKNIVLNLEGGHSLFRKISTGIKDISTYNNKVNDNFYIKLSLAYRVRFK